MKYEWIQDDEENTYTCNGNHDGIPFTVRICPAPGGEWQPELLVKGHLVMEGRFEEKLSLAIQQGIEYYDMAVRFITAIGGNEDEDPE